MNPESIVQAQVEAYNKRDLVSFLQLHAPQVELYNFGNPNPFAVGRAQLSAIYGDVFENSPNLHAEIVHRIVLDNTVMDHEIVTGRKGVDKTEIVAIYEVEGQHIAKAHFIRKA